MTIANKNYLQNLFLAKVMINTTRCGFTTFSEEKTISFSSPGYPVSYDPNLECHWLILSPDPFRQVHLTLIDLRLESCCDYLEVCQQNINIQK